MNILEARQVSKNFGGKQVLNQLDLTVEKGAIFGFVGENGSGKTTTMKLILGLDELSAGEIFIDGEKVRYGETKTNRITGYLPDVPAFYDFMTAKEYLTLCGEITNIPRNQRENRINDILGLVGLSNEKRKIKGFSRGMKQRLGIAQSLLNEPELLICDEPTSALDPHGRSEFLELLASLRGKVTIIFSTHILSDVERICDHVGILHEGKLQVCGPLEQLKQTYGRSKIQVDFDEAATAKRFSEAIKGTQQQRSVWVSYERTSYESALEEVLSIIQTETIVPNQIRRIEPSLEQIFLEVTK